MRNVACRALLIPALAGTALLVGHNPGLEDLLARLLGRAMAPLLDPAPPALVPVPRAMLRRWRYGVDPGPELARVASPCYFKIEPGPALAAGGGIYKPWTDEGFHAKFAVEKVKHAEIIKGLIDEHQPKLKMSALGPKDLAIPK